MLAAPNANYNAYDSFNYGCEEVVRGCHLPMCWAQGPWTVMVVVATCDVCQATIYHEAVVVCL